MPRPSTNPAKKKATTGVLCLFSATTEECKAEGIVGNRGLCGPHRYGVNKAIKSKQCTEAQAIAWKLIEPRANTRAGSVAFEVEQIVKKLAAQELETIKKPPAPATTGTINTPAAPGPREVLPKSDPFEVRVVDYLVVNRNFTKPEAIQRCREARIVLRSNASFESVIAECTASRSRKAAQ